MELIRTLDEFPVSLQHGAVTIGNFDGVHRGHAALVQRLVAQANRVGGPAVVFTFDPHPAHLLYPHAVPPSLTWTERKAELLGQLGADAVIAYPTDPAMLSLTPGEFFEQVIVDRLRARAMVEGPNFYFGRDRSGSIDDLQWLCDAAGIELEVVEPRKLDGQYVSSSWIRQLIQSGDVRRADQLLVQSYRVRGQIVRGAGRGAKIGFPTANIEPTGLVLPPAGVYACRALVEGQSFAAAVHIGPNPTFEEQHVKFEVHVIGCDRLAYDQLLEVEFLDRLRDIRPFEDVAALRRQLSQDVAATLEIVES